jgi:hypothetical protein
LSSNTLDCSARFTQCSAADFVIDAGEGLTVATSPLVGTLNRILISNFRPTKVPPPVRGHSYVVLRFLKHPTLLQESAAESDEEFAGQNASAHRWHSFFFNYRLGCVWAA